jgi:hypothetical protein
MILELLNMVKSWNGNKVIEIQILQDVNNMKKGNKENDGIIQVMQMFKRRTSHMVFVANLNTHNPRQCDQKIIPGIKY